MSRWALSSLPIRYPHWVLGRNLGADPSELRPQGRCLSCSWRGGPLLCMGQRGPGRSLEAAGDAHGLGQGLHDKLVLVIQSPEEMASGIKAEMSQSGWAHGGFCNCPGPSRGGAVGPVGSATLTPPGQEAVLAPALALGHGLGPPSQKPLSCVCGCV